jgi:release factor glutamine methyltransferase
MKTTRSAIGEAARLIAAAGGRMPAVDAAALAAHAWGTTPDGLTELLDQSIPEIYWRFVDRRIAREPVERITGVAVFGGHSFEVHRDVFVPKPETEVLVGLALDYLAGLGSAAPRVVDLCTGSGVVAISIARSSPGARVYGADLSQIACDLSRRNAAGLDVQFECADAAVAFPHLDGTVNLVAANPPYFPADREVRLPEVRDHDPGLALWAGTDGLDVIRSVERAARRLLVPGGLVLVEHGAYQVGEVIRLFSEADSWAGVEDHQVDPTDRTVNYSVLTARRS